MRDLYKRLGIAPEATDADILAAIDGCQHTALRSEASVVLGVKSRRDEYDRLHGLLCDIGRLRARLGLTHGQYWLDSAANDFSLDPDGHRSRHDALVAKVTEAVALHDTFLRWRRASPWIIAAGFAVITTATLAVGFLAG
ncbi:MAG: hypothetical protein UMU75_02705 [Halomonas sp.]|nr:hypothetical protein [Halomonas sp.]